VIQSTGHRQGYFYEFDKGVYRQIFGEGGADMREAKMHIRKQKKTEKIALSWWGVASHLGGLSPPPRGVKK